MVQRYFSAGEAARLAGVSYRHLDYWVRVGVVRASGRSARGRGSRRLFTFADLVEIRVTAKLLSSGLRLVALNPAIEFLRRSLESSDRSVASTRLLTDGTHVFRYLADKQMLETLDEFGQFAFAFDILEEVSGLEEALARMPEPRRYVRKEAAGSVNVGASGHDQRRESS